MTEAAKILLVIPSFQIGGSERQAVALARWLRDHRAARVEVWGLGEPGPISERLDEVEITWRRVALGWPRDPWMRLKGLLRFALALRRARPDAVLAYTVRPNVVCGLSWRLSGARLCIWGQRDEGRDLRVGRGWQRWAARLTPVFVANAEHGERFLVEQLGVRPGRVWVIPNGVELGCAELDRAGWRARLGLDVATPVVCMVANLHRYKDHATLIEAWAEVMAARAELAPVLLLAGRRGATAEQIEARVTELGLEASVQVLGEVDDVAGLLGAADVFAFSSRFEGNPNAVLEAMAAGLPVVATQSPGVREAVDLCGLLVPAGDAPALAAAILRLLAEPAICHDLGALARRRIAEHFTPAHRFEQFAELLEPFLP